MLLKEPNYTRKAQRIDLPLLVQIHGRTYKTKDWSLAGLGILDLDVPFEMDRTIDCRLVLPMDGANFVLSAAIVMKNKRGTIIGCEFKDLAPKNKRVLRRFIELAIEGRIDNVEDFIAAYSEPAFETPISEALALEEKEAVKIKRTFLKKSIAFLFVGAVIALVIGYTTVYNLQYKVFSTGVVTGSLIKITANNSGTLDKIHVGIHDIVDPGLVLFDVMTTKKVSRARSAGLSVKYPESENRAGFVAYVSDVIDALKERAESKRREYEDAVALYAQRFITLKDYNLVYNNYLRAKVDYEHEKDLVDRENERRRDKLRALREKIKTIKTPPFETVDVPSLERRISPIEGEVYRIEHGEGEFVHPDETVMVLVTREKPFVILKLHTRDIYKVKINDHARIYSKYNEISYRGRVTQIGYAAVNADATISQETSLNESLVKIEFLDEKIAFPLNSRVEVRIRRDFLRS
jgi:multidrug resistance efflux pump